MQISMTQEQYHIPALLPQTIEALAVKPGGIYADVTFGGGGHSRAIVDLLDASAGGHLYAFDQDMEALERGFSDPRITLVHGNFRFLRNFLLYYGREQVDGILADLGVSFHHFDDPSRGFSFRADGPLDMRMNRDARVTAADIVATSTPERLAEIFSLYGELKNASRLAKALVEARSLSPVDTTERFLEVVRPFVNPRQEKKELAQIFQALRIEVNGEIDALKELLTQALTLLRPGGRLAVITYHSLEDRLVKNFMKTGNFAGKPQQDFYGRSLAPMRLLTSKPIVPDEEEVERNPRSRSAKLRAAEKL